MEEIRKQVMQALNGHIEMMAGAFLKKTGLSPEEADLVQDQSDPLKIKFYFQKREPQRVWVTSPDDPS